jgi:hypothetical protein
VVEMADSFRMGDGGLRIFVEASSGPSSSSLDSGFPLRSGLGVASARICSSGDHCSELMFELGLFEFICGRRGLACPFAGGWVAEAVESAGGLGKGRGVLADGLVVKVGRESGEVIVSYSSPVIKSSCFGTFTVVSGTTEPLSESGAITKSALSILGDSIPPCIPLNAVPVTFVDRGWGAPSGFIDRDW